MSVLWAIQILVDVALIAAVVRLLAERLRAPRAEPKPESPMDGLTAEDVHQLTDSVTAALDEMKRLAEVVSDAGARESEKALKWGNRLDRLEQIVRADLRRLEVRLERLETESVTHGGRMPSEPPSEPPSEEPGQPRPAVQGLTPGATPGPCPQSPDSVGADGPSMVRRGDRPIRPPRTVRDEIRELHEGGMAVEEIARKLQMGRDEVRLMVGLSARGQG